VAVPTALLRVAVAPADAQVTIDGRPLTGDTITVVLGEIVIRARAAGYRDTTVVHRLERAGRVEAVAISLQQAVTSRVQQSAPTPAPLVGYLKVSGRPVEARVEIEGRLMPQTTPAVFSLSPGQYRIVVRRVDFVSLDTLMRVFAGDTTRLPIALRRSRD
jgi:hypothetical protein